MYKPILYCTKVKKIICINSFIHYGVYVEAKEEYIGGVFFAFWKRFLFTKVLHTIDFFIKLCFYYCRDFY